MKLYIKYSHTYYIIKLDIQIYNKENNNYNIYNNSKIKRYINKHIRKKKKQNDKNEKAIIQKTFSDRMNFICAVKN